MLTGTDPPPRRRQVLAALSIAAAGVAIPDVSDAALRIDTPEAALQTLLAGNRRFAAGRMTSCRFPLTERLRETAEKQTPFAAILSCADSRVPVEMVFDQGLGDLFVARIAGNIATPDIIASLEYGVAVLGVKIIVVVGHGHCGAVKATMSGKPEPGQITALYQFIRPAIDRHTTDLDAAIHANAVDQAHLLATASPVLATSIRRGALGIVPAYYDLNTGAITVIPGRG